MIKKDKSNMIKDAMCVMGIVKVPEKFYYTMDSKLLNKKLDIGIMKQMELDEIFMTVDNYTVFFEETRISRELYNRATKIIESFGVSLSFYISKDQKNKPVLMTNGAELGILVAPRVCQD